VISSLQIIGINHGNEDIGLFLILASHHFCGDCTRTSSVDWCSLYGLQRCTSRGRMLPWSQRVGT